MSTPSLSQAFAAPSRLLPALHQGAPRRQRALAGVASQSGDAANRIGWDPLDDRPCGLGSLKHLAPRGMGDDLVFRVWGFLWYEMGYGFFFLTK